MLLWESLLKDQLKLMIAGSITRNMEGSWDGYMDSAIEIESFKPHA